ncbi:MAG TPA: serine/threonine-protein kinase [Rhodanobacteraceae bacterium]|nr:serine/threonine-protein kinase [Rhodanobacteraceae bacterium]
MQTLQSLRELFEATIELPAAARAAFLDGHCPDATLRRRVERMLMADLGGDVLFTGGARVAVDAIGDDDVAAALPAGSHIGPFELVAVLGEGGSSTVFHARRAFEGVEQQVALKVLRRGLYSPEAQRQFRRERQALAQLRHPGIARLIEGGVTLDGVAYIALDLVEGKPIVEFAREQRLDLRRRLALFLQVCRAVEAAHRALIVHRDLKPSNVLVTEDGQVKLLDFGIAKLLDSDDETRTGMAAFTPAYAAPEQRFGGLVTTATDVYALGILLGELVTGQRLISGSGRTPSSQITGGEAPGVLPAAAALTRRALRGDLDNIVLKAIALEPERRYVSAGALAEDVERMLDGRPVAAHPPSRRYRARKFVQRHRGGVAATLAFALGTLVAFAFVMQQERTARHEAIRANAMRDFMFSAFAEAEPGIPREGSPRVAEVVRQAIAKAQGDTHMNAAARTELLTQLSSVLLLQGQIADAEQAARWNYEHAVRELGDREPLALAAGRELGRCLMFKGDYAGARALVNALIKRLPADEVGLHAELLVDSAEMATKEHDKELALRDGGEGLRLARDSGNDEALGFALSTMGNVQLAANDLQGAVQTYAELVELNERRFGPLHVKLATAHAGASRAWRRLGNLDAAEREIRAALVIDAAVLPKDDYRHANHLNALTMVLRAKRDFPAALEAAEEGLRINRLALGDDNPEVANDLSNIGKLQLRMGNTAAAVAALRETLALCAARFGAEDRNTAESRADYGVALAESGDLPGGEAELRHAIASLEAARKPDLDETAATYEKLVQVERDHGQASAAIPLLDRLDAVLGRMSPASADWTGRSARLRGAVLLAMQDPQRAMPLLRAADDALNGSTNPDPLLRIETSLLLAKAAKASGDLAAASSFAASGLAQLAALRNPPHSLQRLGADVRALTTAAP